MNQREGGDRRYEDIKYPEEIRMEFVCRIMRLFKRALKIESAEKSNDKRAGKSI